MRYLLVLLLMFVAACSSAEDPVREVESAIELQNEACANGDAATITDKQVLKELTALEKQSWEATLRDDTEFFKSFLADEATGMLADGSIIDREQIIKNLADLHLRKYTMGKTSLLRVSEDAAMILYPASYEAVHNGVLEKFSAVNSSALYVRRSGRWKQLFYQETPAGTNPAADNR